MAARKIVHGDELEHARPFRVRVVCKQAREYELAVAAVLHPKYDAFVILRCAVKTLLVEREAFQYALVHQASTDIRESAYEETGHQLMAVGPLGHWALTVGRRVLQEVADEAPLQKRLLDIATRSDV